MTNESAILMILAINSPKWMPSFLKRWWINRQLRKIESEESSEDGIDNEYE